MKRFLGLEIERNSFGDVIVSQKRYIERVLERFRMQDCKPAYTPLPTNIRLHKRDYDPDNPDPPADQTLYREIIGSLNHPAQWSRPDMVNAVSKLSQYLHDLSVNHLHNCSKESSTLSQRHYPLPLSLFSESISKTHWLCRCGSR